MDEVESSSWRLNEQFRALKMDDASQRKIETQRLSSCSFDEALKLWNAGFHGYYVDLNLSLPRYLARLVSDGISVEHSFAAFCEGKPSGFLLNALGTVGGRKVAWNGGTGVSPEYRRRGVATALMAATIELYRELMVEIATLEAIAENTLAISMYRRWGFEVIDELAFLRHHGKIDHGPLCNGETSKYAVRVVSPFAVSEVKFYQNIAPWQSQWMSVQRIGGEAIIVYDTTGTELCYALYKTKFDDKGELDSIVLYQCEVSAQQPDKQAIVASALRHVYSPLDSNCRRLTHNLRKSSKPVQQVLVESGFTVFVEQVQMSRWV